MSSVGELVVRCPFDDSIFGTLPSTSAGQVPAERGLAMTSLLTGGSSGLVVALHCSDTGMSGINRSADHCVGGGR